MVFSLQFLITEVISLIERLLRFLTRSSIKDILSDCPLLCPLVLLSFKTALCDGCPSIGIWCSPIAGIEKSSADTKGEGCEPRTNRSATCSSSRTRIEPASEERLLVRGSH